MKWYYFSLSYLGVFAGWFFFFKSLMNLTEEGRKKVFRIWFFYIWAEEYYFTSKGLLYRNLAYLMSGVALIGFIVGAVLSNN